MAAPPIRIESTAWTDHRFATLAMLLDLSHPRFALILMAGVWCWQTEHYTDEAPTYCVARSVVIGAFGDLRAPEAVVEADLAELMPDGRLRIKGSAAPSGANGKTRINWYWLDKQQRVAAGRGRHEKAKASGGLLAGRYLPAGVPLADAPSRASDKPAAGSSATSGTPAEHQRPATGEPALYSLPSGSSPALPLAGPMAPGELGRLVELAIDRLNDARRKINPAAPLLHPLADSVGSAALRARLLPLPAEEREPTLLRAIAVLAAAVEAGQEPPNELRLGQLAGERSWSKWAGGTVDGVQRADRRRPAPSRATAMPAKQHGTGTIDPKEL